MDNLNVNISQIVQELEKGKNSVYQMRDLLNQRRGFNDGSHDDHDQDYYKGIDGHSTVVLTALETALTALHSHLMSSEDNKDSVYSKKDKRGCYKRRRGVEPTIIDTPMLSDDGFGWRKYGQKVILNSKHPRNYYRCTHKTEGCKATKQVQQISENPPKHRVIYHEKHTCKLNPQVFINSTMTPPHDSSLYLSFDTNKNTQNSSLNFSFSNSIKEETQSEVYNSSPSTSTTTPRSEVSSLAFDDDLFYFGAVSPYRMDVEEDNYNHFMDDFSDLEFFINGNL